MSNETPLYLKDKLPLLCRPLYSQNNSNTFHEIRCKTFRYMYSFFPDTITSWNNVITHFNNIPSFGNLKEHIRSLIRPEKKSIFGIHDPSGVRYLFQLKVGLSPLRYHKNRHNIIDTPSNDCPCNHGIEDTNHFLFLCSFYDIQRATLLNTVIEIIRKYNLNNLGNQSNLYLYGHRSINLDENRKILLVTINYIKETRRFLTSAVSLPPSHPSPYLAYGL